MFVLKCLIWFHGFKQVSSAILCVKYTLNYWLGTLRISRIATIQTGYSIKLKWKYKQKLVICSVSCPCYRHFSKTCQSKAHYSMIIKATFNTHAPYLLFLNQLQSFYFWILTQTSTGTSGNCNLVMDGQNSVLNAASFKNTWQIIAWALCLDKCGINHYCVNTIKLNFCTVWRRRAILWTKYIVMC